VQEGAGKDGPGTDRVTIVYYDGTSVKVDRPKSLEEVPKYLQVHSGAQVWVDVCTGDVRGTMAKLSIDDPGIGPVIHDAKDPVRTTMAYSHTVRGSRRIHRTVMTALGHDLLYTVHDSEGDRDSKGVMTEYIHVLVEKELEGVPKAILYFRDLLLVSLLDTQADEFIGTMQSLIRELSLLHQRLESGEAVIKEARTELIKAHMFVEDEFPAALLSFREMVAKLRMGAGKNVNLQQRHDELEDIMKDIDGAVAIKENVEKTIDLVNSSINTKLTERSIESQRKLQEAVWSLTRLSVILIIPMLVLNFWRLTPWIHSTRVDMWGIQVHAFWFSLLVALVLTIVALLVLHYYLKSKLGGDVEDAFEEPS
jgi:hypothetical protein